MDLVPTEREQALAEFIPKGVGKDGWGVEGAAGASSDFAQQGLIPCQYHPPGQPPFPGTMICSACVTMGLVTQDMIDTALKAGDEPEPERRAAAQIAEQLSLEAQREALRRERIDAAIERGDVPLLHQLGAGDQAIREAEKVVARSTGSRRSRHEPDPEPATAPRAVATHPSEPDPAHERVPVGPVHEEAHGRPGPDLLPDARPLGAHDRTVEQALVLPERLEGADAGAGTGPPDEPFRVPGVDWP